MIPEIADSEVSERTDAELIERTDAELIERLQRSAERLERLASRALVGGPVEGPVEH